MSAETPHFCKTGFFPSRQTHFHLLELDLKGVNTVGGKQDLSEAPNDMEVGEARFALHSRDERPPANMRELGPIPVTAVQKPLTDPTLRLHKLRGTCCCLGKGGNKDGEPKSFHV